MRSMRRYNVPYVWRRQLGYVADFCPICREPRAFRLSSKSLIRQSFYIPVSFGEFVGNERRCLDCGVDLAGDPTRYVALAQKGGSFGTLKKLTYPSFDEAQRGRLELEKAVRKDPFGIDARNRQLLIRQPLELLSPRVEERAGIMRPTATWRSLYSPRASWPGPASRWRGASCPRTPRSSPWRC